MEVASPLPFSHTTAGTKRQFPCTPVDFDTTNRNPFGGIESGDDILHQRSKRRRFAVDESMEGGTENTMNQSLFINHQAFQKPFFPSSTGQSLKRSRTDFAPQTPQHELEKVVTSQATEIQSLKSDKQKLETSLNTLKTDHERVLNENKILKRAVTIQQERQNQAASELNAAHKYKSDAEDRIKKLEHIILSLRYHLQAQQSNAKNDFMGFTPRNPDVY